MDSSLPSSDPIRAQALRTDGHGKTELVDVDIAAPDGDEVLVRICAAGVCHTDLDSLTWGRPLLVGHEGAGVVEAVGPAVTSVYPGDRVVLNWAIPCGACGCCRRGDGPCEVNSPASGTLYGHARTTATLINGEPAIKSFHLGTMATATLVREAAVTNIGDVDIDASAASIIGCAVLTGYGAARRASPVRPGQSVVVLGCGGVGLNAIQAAAVAGAATIVAVDLDHARLDLAESLGATDQIVPEPNDPRLRATAASTSARFGAADHCFEATARPELADAPLAFIRNGGTAVQLSGIEEEVLFDAELFEWNKTYLNPLYGGAQPAIDIPAILRLFAQGRFQLDRLIGQRHELGSWRAAFDDLETGRPGKPVLVIEDNWDQ